MKKTKYDDSGVVFSIPKIINTDLTYYMQFGWKRLKEKSDFKREQIKYSKNIYKDTFKIQED